MEKDRFEVDGRLVAVTPDMITGDRIEASESIQDDDENADRSEIWITAPGSPAEWLNNWDGRQITHDMFQQSYD